MNKSEIFKRAWDLAKIASKRYSETKTFKFGTWITKNAGINANASEFFAECLKIAWKEAKSEARSFIETVDHSASWVSSPKNADHSAVVKMMQAGDSAAAYDSIEMSA